MTSRLNRHDHAARTHALSLEARLANGYRRVIQDAMHEAAARLHQPVLAAADWTPRDADELIDRVRLERSLADAGDEIRVEALRRVMDGILTAYGISFTVRNPLAEGVLAGAGQKVTMISEALRAAIMQQIDQAWQDGLSIPNTATLIREAAPAFSQTRAVTIARTELLGVVNGGSLAAARITGAAGEKTWLATNDTRTREWHAEADGQTVPIDQPFLVDNEMLQYPGDPAGSAENVINCRCVTTYGG